MGELLVRWSETKSVLLLDRRQGSFEARRTGDGAGGCWQASLAEEAKVNLTSRQTRRDDSSSDTNRTFFNLLHIRNNDVKTYVFDDRKKSRVYAGMSRRSLASASLAVVAPVELAPSLAANADLPCLPSVEARPKPFSPALLPSPLPGWTLRRRSLWRLSLCCWSRSARSGPRRGRTGRLS